MNIEQIKKQIDSLCENIEKEMNKIKLEDGTEIYTKYDTIINLLKENINNINKISNKNIKYEKLLQESDIFNTIEFHNGQTKFTKINLDKLKKNLYNKYAINEISQQQRTNPQEETTISDKEPKQETNKADETNNDDAIKEKVSKLIANLAKNKLEFKGETINEKSLKRETLIENEKALIELASRSTKLKEILKIINKETELSNSKLNELDANDLNRLKTITFLSKINLIKSVLNAIEKKSQTEYAEDFKNEAVDIDEIQLEGLEDKYKKAETTIVKIANAYIKPQLADKQENFFPDLKSLMEREDKYDIIYDSISYATSKELSEEEIKNIKNSLQYLASNASPYSNEIDRKPFKDALDKFDFMTLNQQKAEAIILNYINKYAESKTADKIKSIYPSFNDFIKQGEQSIRENISNIITSNIENNLKLNQIKNALKYLIQHHIEIKEPLKELLNETEQNLEKELLITISQDSENKNFIDIKATLANNNKIQKNEKIKNLIKYSIKNEKNEEINQLKIYYNLDEFKKTEHDFCEQQKIFLKSYLEPIEKEIESKITNEKDENILLKLKESKNIIEKTIDYNKKITDISSKLEKHISDLQRCIKHKEGPQEAIDSLKNVVNHMEQLSYIFTKYVKIYDTHILELKENIKSNKLQEIDQNLKAESSRITSYSGFAITPVQRSPRYGLLLKDLMSFFEKNSDHKDFKKYCHNKENLETFKQILGDSYNHIKNTTQKTNDTKAVYEDAQNEEGSLSGTIKLLKTLESLYKSRSNIEKFEESESKIDYIKSAVNDLQSIEEGFNKLKEEEFKKFKDIKERIKAQLENINKNKEKISSDRTIEDYNNIIKGIYETYNNELNDLIKNNIEKTKSFLNTNVIMDKIKNIISSYNNDFNKNNPLDESDIDDSDIKNIERILNNKYSAINTQITESLKYLSNINKLKITKPVKQAETKEKDATDIANSTQQSENIENTTMKKNDNNTSEANQEKNTNNDLEIAFTTQSKPASKNKKESKEKHPQQQPEEAQTESSEKVFEASDQSEADQSLEGSIEKEIPVSEPTKELEGEVIKPTSNYGTFLDMKQKMSDAASDLIYIDIKSNVKFDFENYLKQRTNDIDYFSKLQDKIIDHDKSTNDQIIFDDLKIKNEVNINKDTKQFWDNYLSDQVLIKSPSLDEAKINLCNTNAKIYSGVKIETDEKNPSEYHYMKGNNKLLSITNTSLSEVFSSARITCHNPNDKNSMLMMLKEGKNLARAMGSKIFVIRKVSDKNKEKALQMYYMTIRSGMKPKFDPNPPEAISKDAELLNKFKKIEKFSNLIYDEKGNFKPNSEKHLKTLNDFMFPKQEEIKQKQIIKPKTN